MRRCSPAVMRFKWHLMLSTLLVLPGLAGPAWAGSTAGLASQEEDAGSQAATSGQGGKASADKHATATKEETLLVTAQRLDRARGSLQPSIGATQTRFSRKAIEEIPGGDNASLNGIMYQAPGVAQDSFGQMHIRGDHGDVQFRLDGIALPEGVSVFGQALMTRFAHSMTLTTGVLPAQYGFRQAGVIDIQTKNGITDEGGRISVYGGTRDYGQPSIEYGGHWGKWDAYITADALNNRTGIENTTGSYNAIHDLSTQYHVLGHLRYTLRPETRFSLTAGVSNSWYQLPNIPSSQRQFATQTWLKNPQWAGQAPNAPDISTFNEHQQELSDFAILSWQEEHGNVSAQTSAIMRYSSARYSPDIWGDLYYNGQSPRSARSVFSTGAQSDVTWRINRAHTLRVGFQAYGERVVNKTDTLVYSEVTAGTAGSSGTYNSTPTNIHDGSGKTGALYGVYIQDEWRITRTLTANGGLRFDGVEEYAHGQQLSPRISLVWTPWKTGRFHVSYARYMTPPSFELVSGTSLNRFDNTSGAVTNKQNDPAKIERDNYYDVGFTQRILKGWNIGIDAYWKEAKNLLDEGQFGAPVMYTAFNYRRGRLRGVEVTTDYTAGDLTLYGNFSISKAMGKGISSQQWNIPTNQLAYLDQHWTHMDHDQTISASAGGAYHFFNKTNHPLQLSGTMLYGYGLRRDTGTVEQPIPNGGHVPQYVTFNLGVVQDLKKFSWLGGHDLRLRLDVINLFDSTYQLRDGNALGVGAPQYGLRRSIMGGLSYSL